MIICPRCNLTEVARTNTICPQCEQNQRELEEF